MNIYVHKDGQKYGPFSLDDINSKAVAGEFAPSDAAWIEGLARVAIARSCSRFCATGAIKKDTAANNMLPATFSPGALATGWNHFGTPRDTQPAVARSRSQHLWPNYLSTFFRISLTRSELHQPRQRVSSNSSHLLSMVCWAHCVTRDWHCCLAFDFSKLNAVMTTEAPDSNAISMEGSVERWG